MAHKVFCARIKKDGSKLKLYYKKEKLKLEFYKIQSLENFIKKFIKPFNLEKDRLYNFCLCECKNGDKYFVFNIHHVIFDGVSLNIFLNDVVKFYSGEQSKIKSEFYAFSHDYKKLLESRQQNTFAHKIKNIDTAPAGDISSKNVKNDNFILTKKLENSKEILSFLNTNKITPDSFFISIYALSLFKISGKNECEIKYATTSRFHKDLECSVNSFIEIFPIHLENSSLKELCSQKELHSAHSSFLSTLEADNITTGFVYENDLLDDFIFDEKRTKINIVATKFKGKIHLMIVFKDNYFSLILHYDNKIYSKNFAQNFCELYLKIIAEFLEGKREI